MLQTYRYPTLLSAFVFRKIHAFVKAERLSKFEIQKHSIYISADEETAAE